MSTHIFKKLSIICLSFTALSFSFPLHATSQPTQVNETELELQIKSAATPNQLTIANNATTPNHLTNDPSNTIELNENELDPSNKPAGNRNIVDLLNAIDQDERIKKLIEKKSNDYFRFSDKEIYNYLRLEKLGRDIFYVEWLALLLKSTATFSGIISGSTSYTSSSSEISSILAFVAGIVSGVEAIFVQPALKRMVLEMQQIGPVDDLIIKQRNAIMNGLKETYPGIKFDEAYLERYVRHVFANPKKYLESRILESGRL